MNIARPSTPPRVAPRLLPLLLASLGAAPSAHAIDAVQRLLDLGMHPNSVASELLAVFAQRLAKRICPGCREPATPSAAILAELFPGGAPPGLRCFRGRGCARCNRRGSHGRVAVVEYLPDRPPAVRACVP